MSECFACGRWSEVVHFGIDVFNRIGAAGKDWLRKGSVYRSMYADLGNNQKRNFDMLMQYQGQYRYAVTQEAGIDPKTLRGWLNGDHEATKKSFIRMCLALHLPGFISQHLLEVQGLKLQFQNQEDLFYNWALYYLYLEDMDDVVNFLADQGVNL